jgi:hypothetical protein
MQAMLQRGFNTVTPVLADEVIGPRGNPAANAVALVSY